MNNDILSNDYKARQPFDVTDGYIDNLVDNVAAKAIERAPQAKHRSMVRRISVAASGIAAAIVIAVGAFTVINKSQQTTTQNLDNVLAQLSDAQATTIECYSLDEIPEY